MTRSLRLLTDHDGPPIRGESAASARNLLVREARNGDVRAFAALVDGYYARCLRFALHMLANRSDAEAAVQDTFIRVYRALPKYEEREAFEPWLFRILANRCRSAGAREKLRAPFVEYRDVPAHGVHPGLDEAIVSRGGIGGGPAGLPGEKRTGFLMRHVGDVTH